MKRAAPPIGTWLAKPIGVPAGAAVIGVDGGAVVLVSTTLVQCSSGQSPRRSARLGVST